MKTRTSSLMDSHLVDFTKPNANNIKSNSTTSKKVIRIDDVNEMADEDIRQNKLFPNEISDEEISQEFKNYSENWEVRQALEEGAKWYREQLNLKK
jgi:hypothetical protein